MAETKLVFVYQFLTVGGVEVVLRSRLQELSRRGIDARAIFLRESDGGHELFSDLPGKTAVVTQQSDIREYLIDLNPSWVLSIDSPSVIPIARQAIPNATRVYEVHTAYPYYQRPLLEAHTLEGVRGVIVPSESHGELIEGRLAYPLPVEVVPNPLPEIFFLPPQIADTPERPVIAWVGRLDSLKNWNTFLDIALHLTRLGNFEYWMIGAEGGKNQRAALDVMIKGAGIEDRFQILRQVRHQDMPAVYRSVGLSGGCVVSTSWGESFGLALLEAMASGCPVVAPDVVGIRDVVKHEETGWVYAPMNVNRACDLVVEAVTRPAARARVLAQAEAFAKGFTASASIDHLLRVFEKWSDKSAEQRRRDRLVHYRETIARDFQNIKNLQRQRGNQDSRVGADRRNASQLRAELADLRSQLEHKEQELVMREESVKELEALLRERSQVEQGLRADLAEREKAIQELQSSVEQHRRKVTETHHQLEDAKLSLRKLAESQERAERRSAVLREEIAGKEHLIAEKDALLAEIEESRAWRLIRRLWRFRLWLAPHGTLRESAIVGLLGLVEPGGPRGFLQRLNNRMNRIPQIISGGTKSIIRRSSSILKRAMRFLLPDEWYGFISSMRRIRYQIENNSVVTLYTDNDDLFADYPYRRSLDGPRRRKVESTLVITTKNGESQIDSWFEALLQQTKRPDEVIVVDAGSTDATLDRLSEFQRQFPKWIKVFVEPDASYARGRNVGIRRSRYPYILMTDLGVDLHPKWVERMLHPFECDSGIQVVAGWYESKSESRFGRASKGALVPSVDLISPASFLPSARSIAFSKEAWRVVGGFPEWLTRTGEDTFFSLELKKLCRNWSFVPEAIVVWHAPDTFRQFWRKATSWASGDGEAGLSGDWHWRNLISVILFGTGFILFATISMLFFALGRGLMGLITTALPIIFFSTLALRNRAASRTPAERLWTMDCRQQRMIGFVRGAQNRPVVMARRFADVKGVFFMLAGVPIDDTGGGARSTQLTLELLERGYLVVYINKFPKHESRDLGLRYDHPNLQLFTMEAFHWEAFEWTYRLILEHKPVAAIVEFPLPDFMPIINGVKRLGGDVIYDLIDDWNTSLGSAWYSRRVEQEIIDMSDILLATAKPLVSRLRKLSEKDVSFLPNAVNLKLFNRVDDPSEPPELGQAEFRVIYVGALWGEWFNWDLLGAIGEGLPTAEIIVIGDYRNQFPDAPENIIFLGLKAQKDLPGFLAHSDVAIIPWKVSPITHATSPLKVYEYLAMGLPVVAPPLVALENIPYVFAAEDHKDFIRKIKHARRVDLDPGVLDQFLDENSWRARVESLEHMIQEIGTRN